MSSPAGWYPDPSDHAQLRWWDGSAWTSHTHAAPPAQAPDLTKAPQHPDHASPDVWRAGQGHPGQGHPQQGHPQHQHPYDESSRVKAIATPDGQALAGLGYRLGARLLDGLFIVLITVAAGWQLVERLFRLSLSSANATAAEGLAGSLQLMRNPEMIAVNTGLTTIFLAVSAVYTILPLKFYGATLGKVICGIRVRHWDKAGPPSWGQAVLRWVASDAIGSYLPFYTVIDYAYPLFDRRKQALHDKIARTVVVVKDHRDTGRPRG